MLPQLVETLLTARARSKQTDEQLAEAAGISRATFKRRLREPETFTLGELEALREALRVPKSKMVWR